MIHLVLNNYTIDGDNNTDSILSINCEAKLINNVRKIGNKLIFKTDFNNRYEYLELENPNSFGYKIDHQFKEESTIEISIPENYQINYLPKNLNIEYDGLSLSVSYVVEGNTISINRKVNVNKLAILNNDVKPWNDFIRQIKKQDSNSIVLKTKSL